MSEASGAVAWWSPFAASSTPREVPRTTRCAWPCEVSWSAIFAPAAHDRGACCRMIDDRAAASCPGSSPVCEEHSERHRSTEPFW